MYEHPDLDLTPLTPEEQLRLENEQRATIPADPISMVEPYKLTEKDLAYIKHRTTQRTRNRKSNKAVRKARRTNRK